MTATPGEQPGADNAAGTQPRNRKRRSGSNRRERQRRITFRLSPDEYAALEAAAQGASVTLGTYIRDSVLKAPQTGRRRRPSVEIQAVAKLQAELNRIGGNIHQLLRRVNFGELPQGREEITQAFAGYKEAVAAILVTLGRGAR